MEPTNLSEDFQPQPKKSNLTLYLFFSIICIALVVLFFTYLLKANKYREEVNFQAPIVATDNFSDWEILSNVDFGIEIKHPSNYQKEYRSLSKGGKVLEIYPVPQPPEYGPSFRIYKENPPVVTNIDEYVDFMDESQPWKITERNHVNIYGTDWVRIKYLDVSGAAPEEWHKTYYTIKDGYMYVVVHNEKEGDTHTQNFNKMAETLKFTP